MASRPLRVLLVVESTSGGVGRHVIDLAEGLNAAGHEVELAYSDGRIDGRFKAGLIRLADLGVTRHLIDFPYAMRPADLIAVVRLRRLIRRSKPFDILHLHSSKAGAIGRLARIGIPMQVLYTPHLLRTASPGLSRRGIAVYGAIERALDRFSHATIGVSGFETEHAKAQGLPSRKLHTVENGIDYEAPGDREQLRLTLGVRSDEVLIGFVGRLALQKDPLHLLRSVAALPAENQARLLIIGDGPLEAEARATAKNLGIEPIWLGAADGPHWMAAMDIFVLPSESESFSYALLEAASNGLPIVTTDTGASGEFVLDGTTGYVVPIKDQEALTSALSLLISDAELRRKFGVAGKARMSEYSRDKMVSRTVAIYRQLLNDPA